MGAIQMKNILVISNKAPFDKMHIRESLDTCLIFAAIEQNISWLFKDDAVLALKSGYNLSNSGLKDFFKTLKTLEIYDVEQVYVCAESLKKYALSSDDLSIEITPLSLEEQQSLITKQDHMVVLS
jgi:tRNA 2-thiouridine synthesizing protein C